MVDGLVRTHLDDAGLAQELADGAIRGLVEIPPVDAGAHLRAQLELQGVELLDEPGEFRIVI